jgi:hypothetical protein
MSQSWIVSRLPDRPFLRSGNGTAPPTDGQASTLVGAFDSMGADSRADSGTDHFHRARTRFQTVGQTSSPRGRRPDRFSATIGQTSSVRGEPRRGSRFETIGQTFSPWAGKGTADRRTDLFAGQTFSRVPSAPGTEPHRQMDRPFAGSSAPGTEPHHRQMDRPSTLVGAFDSMGADSRADSGTDHFHRARTRFQTVGQTSSPRGRRPDRFSATIGQTSSVRADRRTDLFAGAGQSARPFRGMGQPRRGRQWDRADNGTGLLSVLLPVGRWMDGGRADDRQMARPLRETSSRDRAGGGVGGATDGANRRAWLGLVALRGADLRRRRYRCAGRGERSSRGSGVGRWWR